MNEQVIDLAIAELDERISMCEKARAGLLAMRGGVVPRETVCTTVVAEPVKVVARKFALEEREVKPTKAKPAQEADLGDTAKQVLNALGELHGWVSIAQIVQQLEKNKTPVHVENVRYQLSRLRESGQVKAEGTTRSRVFAVAGKTVAPKEEARAATRKRPSSTPAKPTPRTEKPTMDVNLLKRMDGQMDPFEGSNLFELIKGVMKVWGKGTKFTRNTMAEAVAPMCTMFPESATVKTGVVLFEMAQKKDGLTVRGFGHDAEFTVI